MSSYKRTISVEGLGWDHSRSSAYGILGISSNPFGRWGSYEPEDEADYYHPSEETVDRELRSEKMYWYIERKIAKWKKKYPETIWFRPRPPVEARRPPSGPSSTRGPATMGLDDIDAYIAAVTAWQHVPNNQGNARDNNTVADVRAQGPPRLPPPAPRTDTRRLRDRSAFAHSPDDPVIPFDNKRSTVSGHESNHFGAIGSPLPWRK